MKPPPPMFPQHGSTTASANATATAASTALPPARSTSTPTCGSAGRGFTTLDKTPFFDADGLATLKAYAQKHHLKTYADLKPLGPVKFGAPPENRTRYFGLVGLHQVYGLNNLQFTPLAEGLNYKALDSGQVDVATIFTTDPQLQSGKYTVLDDNKKLFGFQTVAMVVKQSVLKAEGPEFAQIINKVSSLLTLQAIIKMNAAVALQQQSPDKVAHEFLAANGLV